MASAETLPSLEPARTDVVKHIEFFFGKPNNPAAMEKYLAQNTNTPDFPDAYDGENTKIAGTINNLILSSPQQWQTGSVLPFRQIEGTQVEWDVVQFNVRLMERVPTQGTARMQTSHRRKFRERVLRRGLAMM